MRSALLRALVGRNTGASAPFHMVAGILAGVNLIAPQTLWYGITAHSNVVFWQETKRERLWEQTLLLLDTRGTAGPCGAS